MKLKINLTMICAALLLCLTMNAPPIFAQESKTLPPTTQPSPASVAPQPNPTPPNDKLPPVEIPKDLATNKFVQLLLITVQYQTERADNANRQLQTANGQIAELQTDRNQWKDLFLSERKATTELQVALAESRNESANLRIANQVAANQRELDKNFISTQESEIRRLKRSRWKYAAAGFLGGFATGVPSGALIAVKFNF